MKYLAMIAFLLIATSAKATCNWDWVCNGAGQCKQVPICDSTLDIAPPRPPSIPPIAPPRVQPIPRPTLPPIGTSRCDQVQRQRRNGTWYWDTVCQ